MGLDRLLSRAGELGDVTPDALCRALTRTRLTGGHRDDPAFCAVRIGGCEPGRAP